jgi:hypothetical protein
MASVEGPGISLPVIALLKGVLYRDENEALWQDLLSSQATIRDYTAVLGLELVVDEAEGFAWLRSRAVAALEEEGLPRLMARRQLSFLQSLILVLLRKRLAESDSSGEGQRLILSRDDIVDMVKLFMPTGPNEVRSSDQVMAAVSRLDDYGFMRRLKNQEGLFEVRRVIKSFVDAQWLADFDARLDGYREFSRGEGEAE